MARFQPDEPAATTLYVSRRLISGDACSGIEQVWILVRFDTWMDASRRNSTSVRHVTSCIEPYSEAGELKLVLYVLRLGEQEMPYGGYLMRIACMNVGAGHMLCRRVAGVNLHGHGLEADPL